MKLNYISIILLYEPFLFYAYENHLQNAERALVIFPCHIWERKKRVTHNEIQFASRFILVCMTFGSSPSPTKMLPLPDCLFSITPLRSMPPLHGPLTIGLLANPTTVRLLIYVYSSLGGIFY